MESTDIYEIMAKYFPAKNGFLGKDFSSIIVLLKEFGINDIKSFENLVVEYRDKAVEYDKNFMKDHIDVYKAIEGEEFVNERLKNEYFFSYQALITVLLKFKFPQEYYFYELRTNR